MAKWLVIILILAASLRLIFLNEIPPGPNFDEIQVILNAQSIATTGDSIPGTVTGIFGKSQGNFETGVFSELGSYLLIPWIKIFGASWPYIKLPFIFVNLGMILLVYLIAKRLINQKVALIAAVIFSINPWSIHLGRTAYESLFSYFFYLLAIYIFIRFEGYRMLFAIPALILGFLTYFGAKPQLPPLILAGVFFNYLYFPKYFKKNLKIYILFTILVSLFFIIYSLVFLNNPSSLRLKEIQSETQNQKTTIPSFLNRLADNKFVTQFKVRAESYLGALSPNFLFIEGQTSGPEFLIISDHGPLYLIDFLLIILGVIVLARTYPKALFVTLVSISIALLPNGVSLSAKNYIVRTGLLYPFLIILSASGIWSLLQLSKRTFKNIAIIFVSGIYLLSFLIFINQYFFKTPVDKSSGWNLHNRILSRYLSLESENNPGQKHTVVVNDLNGISYIYLLFSNSYNTSDQINKINSQLAKGSYDFGNAEFTNKCPEKLDNESLIVETKIDCKIEQKNSSQIASPKDNGGKYAIFNDKLCRNSLKKYSQVKNITDLNIESLDKEQFCNNWITSP